MTERELLIQISNIVNGPVSFSQAAEQVSTLLIGEANGKALILDPPEAPDAIRLLDSCNYPYRSLFTVELRDGGDTLGKITLVFASDHFQGSLPQRLSDFTAEQLGMLLARTRLAQRRRELKREIAEIEADLATRKLMQRAEGLLITWRGLTDVGARRWIARQSQKTGLSAQDVAERIIAYHQAKGLLDQKIA